MPNAAPPASFPAPYGGKTVRVYIGPVQEPYRSPDDMLRVFVDLDNVTWSGYAIGGLGADRMVEVSGTAGRVPNAGVVTFAGDYSRGGNLIPPRDGSLPLRSQPVRASRPAKPS